MTTSIWKGLRNADSSPHHRGFQHCVSPSIVLGQKSVNHDIHLQCSWDFARNLLQSCLLVVLFSGVRSADWPMTMLMTIIVIDVIINQRCWFWFGTFRIHTLVDRLYYLVWCPQVTRPSESKLRRLCCQYEKRAVFHSSQKVVWPPFLYVEIHLEDCHEIGIFILHGFK